MKSSFSIFIDWSRIYWLESVNSSTVPCSLLPLECLNASGVRIHPLLCLKLGLCHCQISCKGKSNVVICPQTTHFHFPCFYSRFWSCKCGCEELFGWQQSQTRISKLFVSLWDTKQERSSARSRSQSYGKWVNSLCVRFQLVLVTHSEFPALHKLHEGKFSLLGCLLSAVRSFWRATKTGWLGIHKPDPPKSLPFALREIAAK